MNDLDDVTTTLRAKLDWVEELALAASTDEDHDMTPPGGVGWHWVDANSALPLDVEPDTNGWSTAVCVGDREDLDEVSLESTRDYPASEHVTAELGGELPMIAIVTGYEVPLPVGAHLQFWDPRRAISLVNATRLILDEHAARVRNGHEDTDTIAAMITVLATVWLAT